MWNVDVYRDQHEKWLAAEKPIPYCQWLFRSKLTSDREKNTLFSLGMAYGMVSILYFMRRSWIEAAAHVHNWEWFKWCACVHDRRLYQKRAFCQPSETKYARYEWWTNGWSSRLKMHRTPIDIWLMVNHSCEIFANKFNWIGRLNPIGETHSDAPCDDFWSFDNKLDGRSTLPGPQNATPHRLTTTLEHFEDDVIAICACAVM